MDGELIVALVEHWNDICKIHQIILQWSKVGDQAKLIKNKKGEASWVPQHPEFIYRREAKWNGWNEFLGIVSSTEEGKKNLQADYLEKIAWQVVEAKYLSATVPSHEDVPPST
jgi:hypothetical protein